MKPLRLLVLFLVPLVAFDRADDSGPRYFAARPGALAATKTRLAAGLLLGSSAWSDRDHAALQAWMSACLDFVTFDRAELAPILRAASPALPEPACENIVAGLPGTAADRFQLLSPLPR